MDYATLIDPTDLGTVASYLRNPHTPIHLVLHVRERASLAPLAVELDAKLNQSGATGREVLAVIEQHVRARALLLSPRPSGQPLDPQVGIDLDTLPATALCDVIYLPPFYLAHTPGLFEGTLARTTVAPGHRQVAQPSPRFRMKP